MHDANLLIDLFHGGLLEIWFAQGYEIHTTSLVLTELTDADQKAAANDLVSLGALIISDTAANEWSDAEKLARAWGVSIPDASVGVSCPRPLPIALISWGWRLAAGVRPRRACASDGRQTIR